MKLQKIKAVILIFLCVTTPLLAQSTDDFLRFLEMRDESIKSYEIKLRRFHLDIELDDYEAFKESIEQLAQNEDEDLDSTQQAEQFVQKWTDEPRRLEQHSIWQGGRFKETTVVDSNITDIEVYDGRLYYDYSVRNRQLDIHSDLPNTGHANLTDIGYTNSMKSLRARGKILSFEQNDEGIQCVFTFSDTDSRTTTHKYNRDLGLCYSNYKMTEQIQIENYYLLHKNIEGYSVPGISINLNPYEHRNECSIYIYAVEDVKFNPVLTNEDFSLGDIPDDTLVIDKRFEPSVQWRYGEYLQAVANPDNIYNGRGRPEDMIQFLDRTSSGREALFVRDSRTGRQAPPLQIREWLLKPPDIDAWPPGQFTVLEFWDIGCGPCISSIAKNNELAEFITNKGGLFVSIHSPTENFSGVKDIIEIHEIQYTVGLDTMGGGRTFWGGRTFAEYGIDGIPSYVTIAENGQIITYQDLTKDKLEKILVDESGGAARQQIGRRSVRKLTAIPNAWFADNLEPNSQVQGRFFIFRPETPEIILQRSNSDNIVKAHWSQCTFSNQTVEEVLFSATAPTWGETIKGNIDIIAEHSQVFEFLTIPYELRSRSLAQYVSPIIWFGPIQKGNSITRRISLLSAPNHRVSVNALTVPSQMEIQIHDSEQGSNDIIIECAFSSDKTGLQRDALELLAADSLGNKQTLNLEYCALVLP